MTVNVITDPIRETMMLGIIKTFENTKLYWLMLVALGICLELVALFYQYKLEYWPCVLCIHVRVWVLAFILLALIGLAIHRNRYLRTTIHLLITLVMVALLERAWQLVGVERGTVSGSCGMESGLPDWFALDQWFPAMFKVWEPCGYTPILAFGISMAEALLVLFSLLTIIGIVMTLSSILNARST